MHKLKNRFTIASLYTLLLLWNNKQLPHVMRRYTYLLLVTHASEYETPYISILRHYDPSNTKRSMHPELTGFLYIQIWNDMYKCTLIILLIQLHTKQHVYRHTEV